MIGRKTASLRDETTRWRSQRQLPKPGSARWLGAGAGAFLVGFLVLVLLPFREEVSVSAPALLLVVPVVTAAIVGGSGAAAFTAFLATAALNLAFLPPYGRPDIDVAADVIALAVFLAIALATGTLVAGEARRRQVAERRVEEVAALQEQVVRISEERARLADEAARIQVLEEVDAQRGALLRSVSHDLRTPLATIRAVTSDLQSDTAYDEPTRRELLELVGDEAERLDRIVANLLSLSRIEAGALQPERQAVELDELVAHRVKRLGRLFSQVRLRVEVPDDLPLVDGDYVQLDQVISNLLENSARYAPPRSAVSIKARTVGGSVEVRVSDEGIGVNDHERVRIFEAFRRGEGSRSSGVGLAICRGIVEAHGGSIWVERTDGGGATFVFTLPIRRGPR